MHTQPYDETRSAVNLGNTPTDEMSTNGGSELGQISWATLIAFREAPSYLFDRLGLPVPPADHLSIRIQPDEGIVRVPGEGAWPTPRAEDRPHGLRL